MAEVGGVVYTGSRRLDRIYANSLSQLELNRDAVSAFDHSKLVTRSRSRAWVGWQSALQVLLVLKLAAAIACVTLALLLPSWVYVHVDPAYDCSSLGNATYCLSRDRGLLRFCIDDSRMPNNGSCFPLELDPSPNTNANNTIGSHYWTVLALRKTQIALHCVMFCATVLALGVNIACIVPGYKYRRLCCVTDWVCAAFVAFAALIQILAMTLFHVTLQFEGYNSASITLLDAYGNFEPQLQIATAYSLGLVYILNWAAVVLLIMTMVMYVVRECIPRGNEVNRNLPSEDGEMYVVKSAMPSRRESERSVSVRPLYRSATAPDLQTYGPPIGLGPVSSNLPTEPSPYLDVEVAPPIPQWNNPLDTSTRYAPETESLPLMSGAASVPKPRLPRARIPPDYTNSAFVADSSWHTSALQRQLQFERAPPNSSAYCPQPVAGSGLTRGPYAYARPSFIAHM